MAKIFYLGGGTHVRGMLRAVVFLEQLQALLSPEMTTHLGHDFPEMSNGPITLIEILREEATPTWPAGFCHVNASPADFDERLRFLPEPNTSHDRPKKQTRRNLGLIHWLVEIFGQEAN